MPLPLDAGWAWAPTSIYLPNMKNKILPHELLPRQQSFAIASYCLQVPRRFLLRPKNNATSRIWFFDLRAPQLIFRFTSDFDFSIFCCWHISKLEVSVKSGILLFHKHVSCEISGPVIVIRLANRCGLVCSSPVEQWRKKICNGV